MADWTDFAAAEPDFAGRVRAVLDANVNKILATLRADGSPRVSGIELSFRPGGLYFGSMPAARKLADLLRDPRFALHSASPDPPADPTAWVGDAKLAGTAVQVEDPAEIAAFRGEQVEIPDGPFHLFRIDVREVALTRVGTPADHLVIEFWRDGGGLQRFTRA